MPERRPVDEAWSRILDANIRYYRELSKVSVDYLTAVVGVLGQVRLPIRLRASTPATATPAPRRPVAPTARPSSPSTAIVLEGEGGARAVGVFMVENRLSHPVSAPIVASVFTDPDGREVRPAVVFEPDTVTVAPGEHCLVHISALIPEELERGVEHVGEVSVPGLGETSIRLVLRRHVTARPAAGAEDAATVHPAEASTLSAPPANLG